MIELMRTDRTARSVEDRTAQPALWASPSAGEQRSGVEPERIAPPAVRRQGGRFAVLGTPQTTHQIPSSRVGAVT